MDNQNPGQELYFKRAPVMARSIKGTFRNFKNAVLLVGFAVYFLLPWLPWDRPGAPSQSVLFDIPGRRYMIFDLTVYPQDVFWLSILLFIAAAVLFFITALAGRAFCGYFCFQTLWTDAFMWLEHWIQGERPARLRLYRLPWSNREKLFKVGATKLAFVLLSFWTALTFVFYFGYAPTLLADFFAGQAPAAAYITTLALTASTYLAASTLREHVCTFICPYGRFQSAMYDAETLTVHYDRARGEREQGRAAARAGLRAYDDRRYAGYGDCIDCGLCVQVCPVGIDIRDGLQYECIGCSACIDACDQVMDKMDYPRGLIRYSTEHAIAEHWGRKQIVRHILRPRTLLYGAILSAIVIAAAVGLTLRQPLKVDVIRDRATLTREVEGGLIENVYRLQIMNLAEEPRRFALSVTGLKGLQIDTDPIVEIPAAATQAVSVRVRVEPDAGKRGSNRIHFEIRALGHDDIFVREKASFLLP